jgi:hypothetical protein
MKKLTIKSFDYAIFDKQTKGKLIWYAGEIRKQGKTHLESGLAAGKLLAEARQLSGEQTFTDWVETECGCSIRTAYNYITAWQEFGSCATVAHLELSAMYTLAKNERAKKRALKMADKGLTVTQKVAKELVKEAELAESLDHPPGGGESTRAKPEPCPNCGTNDWDEDDLCRKCNHPYGEPVGDEDEPEEPDWHVLKRKAVKTAEALLRAVDDLNEVKRIPKRKHQAHALLKELLPVVSEWGK